MLPAAFLPSPMARMTVAAPRTMSPPAKTPSIEVCSCRRSRCKPHLLTRRSGDVEVRSGFDFVRWPRRPCRTGRRTRIPDLDGTTPSGGVGLAELHPDALEPRTQPFSSPSTSTGAVRNSKRTPSCSAWWTSSRRAGNSSRERRYTQTDSAGQSARSSDGVHGHVAAAHDRHALAVQDRGVGVGVVGAHQVDAGQVLVGRVDALKFSPGTFMKTGRPAPTATKIASNCSRSSGSV